MYVHWRSFALGSAWVIICFGLGSVIGGCLANAHASGWLLGTYTVPDTLPAQVHGLLCQDGTCQEKAVWDAAGYGVPIQEGAKGDTVRFRVSLSSSGPQNVVLYLWRERDRKVSQEIAPVRIVTQARADTLCGWTRPDSSLVAWAEPVAGVSPLGRVYSYSFDPWETEDVMLLTQSAIQWHYRDRLRAIFGYYVIGGVRLP